MNVRRGAALLAVACAVGCGSSRGARVSTGRSEASSVSTLSDDDAGDWVPIPPEADDDPYSVYLGRRHVSSLVFVDARRVFLTNELGELFESVDGGAIWAKVPTRRVGDPAVANGSELWMRLGGTSNHGPPGGLVAWSRDWGRTWSGVGLEPSRFENTAMLRRIPALFVNQPNESPLLVMWDGAIVRPIAGQPFESWAVVGATPFQKGMRVDPLIQDVAKRGETLYASAMWDPDIGMSRDGGKTWDVFRLPISNGRPGEIECDDTACYVLVDEAQGAVHLFRATLGSKEWRLTRTFNRLQTVSAFVTANVFPPAAHDFVVCGILPAKGELMLAGFAFSANYQDAWSASFQLAPDGAIVSPKPFSPEDPRAGRDTVCNLALAPDGTRWASGLGAYRLEDGTWRRVWKYPAPDRPRPPN